MTVRIARALVVALGVALAGCAAPARAPVEAPALAAPPSPAPTPPPVAEPPRQADALMRITSELVELQNAVAKLMMSARQHDDQLLYLQRRLTELDTQARSARTAQVPGFAAAPAPLPPPPVAAAPPVAAPLPPPPAPAARPAPPAAPAPSASLRPAPPAAPPAPPVAPPAPPSAAAPSPASALYQSGLAKFQAGELDGAVVTLYEVVANYPKDPARERAQLLIGEIFSAQKDYRGAIAELEGLIAAVPAGTHVPDALLRIGMAQRSLGDEARARRAWTRLVRDYANSAAAQQARTLLRPGRG